MTLYINNEDTVAYELEGHLTYTYVGINLDYSSDCFPWGEEFCKSVIKLLNPEALYHLKRLNLNTRRLPAGHGDALKQENFQNTVFQHLAEAGTNVETLELWNAEYLRPLHLKMLIFDSNLARNMVNLSFSDLTGNRLYLTLFLAYLQMRNRPLLRLHLEGIHNGPHVLAEQRLLWRFLLKLSLGRISVSSFLLGVDVENMAYASLLLLRMNKNGLNVSFLRICGTTKPEVLILLSGYMKSRKKNSRHIETLISVHRLTLSEADIDSLKALSLLDSSIPKAPDQTVLLR